MTDVDWLIEKGRKFFDDGKYYEAVACFEQALLLKKNDPELWNIQGAALRSIGRYEEASHCFNKSLEIDPRDRHSS